MATHGNIGVENPDGTFTFIYHNWDGYPEYLGVMLIDHYNSASAAESIVALGDLSVLRERLAPDDDEEHSFGKPLDDVTVAYGRDRGEEDIEARTCENIRDVFQNKHAYVWRLGENGWWYLNEGCPLAEVVERLKNEDAIVR